MTNLQFHPLVQLLIKHLKQIEIIYYTEGKDVTWRASHMRAEAQSGISAFDEYADQQQGDPAS